MRHFCFASQADPFRPTISTVAWPYLPLLRARTHAHPPGNAHGLERIFCLPPPNLPASVPSSFSVSPPPSLLDCVHLSRPDNREHTDLLPRPWFVLTRMPFTSDYPADTAPRVEGVPFYELTTYTLVPDADDAVCDPFSFHIRAFRELPFCDAVGLLSGDDHTGLIVWSGALAMIEWLVHGDPSRTVTAMLNGGSAPVLGVELGCGCGVVTVALQKHLIDRAPPVGPCPRIQLLCTDGNPSCVALAQRNVEAFAAAPSSSVPVECAADVLLWGDNGDDYTALLKRHGVDPDVWCGSLFLISADVIYSREAIPLLVSTVTRLHALLHVGAADRCQTSPPDTTTTTTTTWWLLYTPRSLTQAMNVELFTLLVDTLDSQQPDWVVQRHALPANSVVTGFESFVANAHGVDRNTADALLGCLFEVRITASPPTP